MTSTKNKTDFATGAEKCMDLEVIIYIWTLKFVYIGAHKSSDPVQKLVKRAQITEREFF